MNQPQNYAEHGKVTLTGDPADDDSVMQLNPETDHISFEQMIRDFVKRYPATLEFVFRHWNEVHFRNEVH